MNGAEHYKAAEEALETAKDADGEANPEDVALMLRFAEVHATLALAAATALQPSEYPMDRPEIVEWQKVAAVEKPGGES